MGNYVSVFFTSFYVSIKEKSFILAEKCGLGFCAQGLNALIAKTSVFVKNGRSRSLICIYDDFDRFYLSI